MENIEQFIKGCKVFGLKDGDIFQTADLYECQNMSQVRNLSLISLILLSLISLSLASLFFISSAEIYPTLAPQA